MLRDMPDFMLEIVEGPEAGRRIPLSGPLELGRDPMIGASLLQDELVSLPMLVAIDDRPAEGKLVREFTSTHAVPDLQIARPLTALHQTPAPSEN